jgi:hypothetical protein
MRSAEDLPQPLGGDVEEQEIVAAPAGQSGRDLLARGADLRVRRDEAQPLQHAQHMGVDDEDRPCEPAGVERGCGDLAAHTRQALQPGQRLCKRQPSQEIEIEIRPLARNPF